MVASEMFLMIKSQLDAQRSCVVVCTWGFDKAAHMHVNWLDTKHFYERVNEHMERIEKTPSSF